MLRISSIRTLCALVATTVLSAVPASAQSIPSPYRFIEEGQEGGLFAGYFNADAGRFGFGPKSGLATGARYGLELSGPIGLEGVATLAPVGRDVINPGRDEGDRIVDEAESAILFLEVRLRLALTGRRTWHGLQPYFFAGGGAGLDVRGNQAEDQLLSEADRFNFGTKFLGTTGGGVRVMLPGRFVLRLDAAMMLYQLQTPSGFLDPLRNLGDVPENEWVSAKTLSLGLAYRF